MSFLTNLSVSRKLDAMGIRSMCHKFHVSDDDVNWYLDNQGWQIVGEPPYSQEEYKYCYPAYDLAELVDVFKELRKTKGWEWVKEQYHEIIDYLWEEGYDAANNYLESIL
jgi:hypothetical protein